MSTTPIASFFVALAALSVAAMPVRGQDSVSTTNGLPGDALAAYTTGASGTQVKNYVVDLAPLSSSWNRRYYLGPIAKSSLSTTSGYFNHLIGAQAVSNRFTGVQTFLRPSYVAWIAQGQGVNTARNTTPTDNGTGRYGTLNVASLRGQSFGAAFMEYGGGPLLAFGDADDENNIVAVVAGFQPYAPSRIFVARIVAATNRAGAAATQQGTASLGLGGIDEAGTVHLLADGFGVTGAINALTQKQLWRVDATLRSNTFNNNLNVNGFTDTTTGLSQRLLTSDTSQTTPAILSRTIAGRPVLIGADFANNYLAETSPGTLTATADHLPSGASLRGPISLTARVFGPLASGSDAATCAGLARAPSATKTRAMAVWTITAAGVPGQRLLAELPSGGAGTIVDPIDGFDPFNAFGSLGNHEFTNYGSQVCFRGGNGPIALTVLPDGDLLAAATVAPAGGGAASPQGMDQYIAVVRIDAAGTPHWTIAAHTGDSSGAAGGISKRILGDYGLDGLANTGDIGEGDGIPDPTDVGRIARYDEVYKNAQSGPSISSPAMDRMGNLYFLASVSLRRAGPPALTTALLRANRDPATGGYTLELLTELGAALPGLNSTRNYQVQLLGPADSDSVDSGALWSGNIVQDLNVAVDPTSIAAQGASSLGALVFRTRITYDMNGDGQYLDPTLPGNAASPDQAYNALMLLVPKRLLADVDQDGFVTGIDFDLFVEAYFTEQVNPNTGLKIADVAASGGGAFPDGFITGEDFDRFVEAYFLGE